MQKTSLMLMAVLTLTNGCRPQGQPGSLTYSENIQPHNCQAGPHSRFDPNDESYPKTRRFIQEIADFLMRANPTVFTGEFAASNLCFGVSENDDFNAYATPANKAIVFNTGLFRHVSNEKEVAAVMAHELAHITKQHYTTLSYAEFNRLSAAEIVPDRSTIKAASIAMINASQTYRNISQEYLKFLDALSQESTNNLNIIRRYHATLDLMQQIQHIEGIDQQAYQTHDATLASILDDLYQEIGFERARKLKDLREKLSSAEQSAAIKRLEFDHIHNEMLYLPNGVITPEQQANDREREADEFGLRYYLNTRLDPEGFSNYMKILVNIRAEIDSSPLMDCLMKMVEARRLLPERSTGSHPTPCWRWMNSSLVVPMSNAKEFAPLIANATLLSIATTYTLAEVRAEAAEPKEEKTPLSNRPSELDEQSLCAELGGQWSGTSGDGFCDVTYHDPGQVAINACTEKGGIWHYLCQCVSQEEAKIYYASTDECPRPVIEFPDQAG